MNIQLPITVKQFAIILGIGTVALGSGALLASKFRQPAPPEPTPVASPSVAAIVSPKPLATKVAVKSSVNKGKFTWGIALRPELFPNEADNLKFIPVQMAKLKELGVDSVRVDYSPTKEAINQKVLDEAKKNGIKVVFIIPFGPNDIKSDKNLYDNAYNYVKKIVSRHKGQEVWQLGTEVATVALKKPDLHGVDFVDYPDSTYKPVATWLKAATKAVADTDPAAKRLLNDQWVHVGFFEKFLKEGGQFEIIGWNWFSDMGTDFEKPTIDRNTGQKYELMKKLRSFNKEIWLTEVNRRNGDADGDQKAQADFIETIANRARKIPEINGFIVFHFIGEQGYGIADINYEAKVINVYKQAYERYKTIIQKNR